MERCGETKNSQLAREIEIALPVELTKEQNVSLAREYVNQHFVSVGMCVDVAIHDTKKGNPHAHIMLTMRPMNEGGTWGDKQRKEYVLGKHGEKIYDPKKRQYKCKSIPAIDWNEQTKAELWRAAWAEAVNAALERQDIEARVDHRSYTRQGVEQIPTVHLGVAATQMERKGIATERGDMNREIRLVNMQSKKLQKELQELKLWLKRELRKPAQSSLADMIEGILGRERQAGRLDGALAFLREHEIRDLAGLQGKVREIYKQLDDLRVEMKPVSQRMDVLAECIRQVDIRREHRSIYEEYRALTPRKQAKFFAENESALVQYEAAGEYLKGRRNDRNQIPMRAWKKELDTLSEKRRGLYVGYDLLKVRVRDVEKVRYAVEDVLSRERVRGRRRNRARDRGMER
ncbi:MAG: MobA/MobL family protein [Oscillospiraceae bacterium]|nr:MobA/MobL family protein [Oscillospiraceae bacterium]